MRTTIRSTENSAKISTGYEPKAHSLIHQLEHRRFKIHFKMEREFGKEVKVPMLHGSDDYFEWAERMRYALMENMMTWWVVSGEYPRPEVPNDQGTKTRSSSTDDELAKELQQWKLQNSRALSLIAQKIAPFLMHLIRDETEARGAWLTLEHNFKKDSLQRVHHLETAWRDLRQKPGTDSFAKFVADIQNLAGKLSAIGRPVTEIDKTGALVKGIRPDMASTVHAVKWELEDAFEDKMRAEQDGVKYDASKHRNIFDRAVRRLRAEEERLPPFVDKWDKPAGSALAAHGKGQKRSGGGSRPNTNNGPKAPIECYVCGKNHFAYRCPDRKGKSKKGRDANAADNSAQEKGGTALTARALGVTDIPDSWIMDSGATHHMTGRIEAFHSIKPADIGVKLGDGTLLPVHGQGEVWLDANLGNGKRETLYLKDVYYIPTLQMNLFSLDRVQEKKCIVYMDNRGSRVTTKSGKLLCKGTRHQRATYLDAREVDGGAYNTSSFTAMRDAMYAVRDSSPNTAAPCAARAVDEPVDIAPSGVAHGYHSDPDANGTVAINGGNERNASNANGDDVDSELKIAMDKPESQPRGQEESLERWHQRLGHIAHKAVRATRTQVLGM